jgi:hypothetical protein
MTLDTPYDASGADRPGCHAGAEKMKAQAVAAGSAELLEGFARDPVSFHESGYALYSSCICGCPS